MNEQLRDDINLLLENSELDVNPHFEVNTDTFEIKGKQPTICMNPDELEIAIKHPQARSISKLYYQQNKKVQTEMRKSLLERLDSGYQTTKTIVDVFFEIGCASELISYLKENFTAKVPGYATALVHINAAIFLLWPNLTKEEVRTLRSWCEDVKEERSELGEALVVSTYQNREYKSLFDAIHQQTNRILVIDVKKRIDLGFNPEINIDEEELKQEFSKFGFPADLSEALNKIDQKLSTSKDAFDFKGCMDLLRSFTERFYRSILDQYGDEGKKVKEQDSEEVAKFFKEKGLVGSNFAEMMVSQRHFLSNLASHRLKSREEDARLSKNMVIEMSLYLLRRYQTH